MTTKTKMSNLESYQELSIQIACLSMKIDKVLELLNKPQPTNNHNYNLTDTEPDPAFKEAFLKAFTQVKFP